MLNIQAIRGMNDVLPLEAPYWEYLENICRELAKTYSYQEIRTPLIEATTLFKRGIGEHTDIVEKEMYTFLDRNGDSLSLRPEGTASCVRAGIEHGLFHNQIQRLWYLGPMFRHERPQKGRYRQFYHFGVEAYGMSAPDIDVELILMSYRLWKKLQIEHRVELQLNTLGTRECRAQYRQTLIEYFQKNITLLDEDSQKRLLTNPLRILDSKNPHMQSLIAGAPKLIDYLDHLSLEYFTRLRVLLDAAQIPYVINPTLVRGLDYYGMTVFEWVTNDLGAQGTVCAGGRYDDLLRDFGEKTTPAIGFACGLERLILLLKNQTQKIFSPDIYAILVGEEAVKIGLCMAEKIRDALPHIKLEVNLNGGKFKNQFKRADKSGARWALIIGDDEVSHNTLSLKNLRHDAPQQNFTIETLIDFLKSQGFALEE